MPLAISTFQSIAAPPDDVAANALRGRDIVCFSNDWNGDPLSKTHFMRLLARDNRILWVNSIGYRRPRACKADAVRALRKVAAAVRHRLVAAEPNLYVLNPLAVPAYGMPMLRPVNRLALQAQVKWAMRSLGFQRPISWLFLPSAAVVAGALGEEMLIYHCVDEFSAFAGVPSDSIAQMERRLIERADLVIVSAQRLYQTKAPFNRNTVLVRHGVDYSHFCRALDPQTSVPQDIARLPKPILLYFGLMSEDWFDAGLVRELARRFPQASVVLLGKITMDLSELRECPNVHVLGRKPYQSLPGYCKAAAVAINPFPINNLTLHSNPLKVREYLAAGLPVVSTAIPEVDVLGLCHIGHNTEGFIGEVGEALKDPGPSLRRSVAIRHESWNARLDEIRRHVARLEDSRAKVRETGAGDPGAGS